MEIPTPAPGSVLVFTTTVCPYCTALLRHLDAKKIPFEQIDVDDQPEYDKFVKSVNDGDRTVPTVVFPDGTTATNPKIAVVRDRLATSSGGSSW